MQTTGLRTLGKDGCLPSAGFRTLEKDISSVKALLRSCFGRGRFPEREQRPAMGCAHQKWGGGLRGASGDC
jgi:hypothetical protein